MSSLVAADIREPSANGVPKWSSDLYGRLDGYEEKNSLRQCAHRGAEGNAIGSCKENWFGKSVSDCLSYEWSKNR